MGLKIVPHTRKLFKYPVSIHIYIYGHFLTGNIMKYPPIWKIMPYYWWIFHDISSQALDIKTYVTWKLEPCELLSGLTPCPKIGYPENLLVCHHFVKMADSSIGILEFWTNPVNSQYQQCCWLKIKWRFPEMGVPQIIHLVWDCAWNKPSVFGVPPFWETSKYWLW